MKRNEKLIKTRLISYLIPSIMTNMALQVGNIVDTILVGNILGTDEMSAVQVAGTILLLIQIPGWMLGIGGSIVAGTCLGKRDIEGAGKVFSSCLLFTIISGILLMSGAFFADPVALFLTGGGSRVTPLVAQVVRANFLSTPVLGVALLMIHFMSVDNNPQLSTMYVIIANVVNLIADYLLLSKTPIGPAGSTASTVLGYGAALVTVILYARSPKRMLRLTPVFTGAKAYFVMAFVTGVPALLSIVCEMVRNTTMNVMAQRLVGIEGLTVYTVCLNLVMLVELFLGGIIEAMDKIGGVLFGEKDTFGIKSLVKNILSYSFMVTGVLLVLLYVFTESAAGLFGIQEPAMLADSVSALRIFFLALPGYVINRFFISYYQTTEHTGYANLITILEYCGALLPLVFIFTYAAGIIHVSALNGMMAGLVAGEYVTVLITFICIKLAHRNESIFLLEETGEAVLDFSVGADMQQAGGIPREIIGFCEGRVDHTKANCIAIAAEEMAANVIRYGGSDFSSIDVMLLITSDKMLLRLRDDGKPFDPTTYEFDGEGFGYSGIKAVRALTDRISYMRMLDFNNTTIEIDLAAGDG